MTFLRTIEMQKILKGVSVPEGEQIHINHEECFAGIDRKKRLYIKKFPTGHGFYCHHCGMKGYLRDKEVIHRVEDKLSITRIPEPPHSLYLEELKTLKGEHAPSKWPVEARVWWYSYGLMDEDAISRGAQWHNERLCIPWHTFEHEVWSCRSFNKDRSKVLTLTSPQDAALVRACKPSKPLILGVGVVVEDVLSAIKINKAGYLAVPLFGTTLSVVNKSFICDHLNGVVIWLDDDVAGALGSVKLYTELKGMHDRVTHVRNRQPKELSVEEIQETINKCTT